MASDSERRNFFWGPKNSHFGSKKHQHQIPSWTHNLTTTSCSLVITFEVRRLAVCRSQMKQT